MPAPRKVKENARLAEQLIVQRAEANTQADRPATAEPAPQVPNVPPEATQTPMGVNPYAVSPTAAMPPSAPNSPQQGQSWEHKYSVLQGMMTKTQNDSRDQIQQLQNQINVLTNLAQKPSAQDTFHPQAVPAATPAGFGLTEEEIEELGGQDFVDSIAKIGAAGSSNQIAGLKDEIETLKGSQQEALEAAFFSRLTQICPNWSLHNKNDAFEEWLLGNDGLTGIPRRTFLMNGYEQWDADTVARYFLDFESLLQPQPSLNPEVTQDVIPRSNTIAPSTTAAGGATYTRESIGQFFKDKGLGKFRGREEEAAAIERDIFAAQKENRIVQSRRAS